jgi:hypothetical protein
MSTLISGLNEADCRDFVGVESWNKHVARWCAPDKLAAEASGQPLIWLYRAPWSTLGQMSGDDHPDIQGGLARWLEQNRGILNMRRQFSDNQLLVNTDRVRPADLRARLAGAAVTQDAIDNLPTSLEASCGSLLGQLFHWSAPQYWDVLEALEAAAWLPFGEPLFRGDCTASEAQLNTLLDVMHGRRELHPLRQTPDEDISSNHHLKQENSELRQESELLLLQFQQVQEELEQHHLKYLELDTAATAGRETAVAASHQMQQLQQARDDAIAGHHKLEQENSELRQEGELLLLQLHQVQEELEQYYLKNLDLDKAVTAGQKAAADTQKTLAQAQKALVDAQRKAKALQLQLQQMQDELKHQQALFAASVAQSARKTSTLARWVPSPARRMISHSRDKKTRLSQLDAIRKSSWFDPQWYLDTYPDIRAARIDPVEHYLTTGWKENRNPCSGFDTAYYLRSNPDITYSGLNPLWHFIAFGSKEGRLPHKP